jgi:hypothetical protein
MDSYNVQGNLRNARVRIRINASSPTRKKDPTSAMYSALRIELAICPLLVCHGRLRQHLPVKNKACLHVQAAKKRYRGHALLLRDQKYKEKLCTQLSQRMWRTAGRLSKGDRRKFSVLQSAAMVSAFHKLSDSLLCCYSRKCQRSQTFVGDVVTCQTYLDCSIRQLRSLVALQTAQQNLARKGSQCRQK